DRCGGGEGAEGHGQVSSAAEYNRGPRKARAELVRTRADLSDGTRATDSRGFPAGPINPQFATARYTMYIFRPCPLGQIFAGPPALPPRVFGSNFTIH